MRTIRCTTGEDTFVDDWNYDYLSQYTWRVQNGYVIRSTQDGQVFLHKEVLSLVGYVDFGIGDHRNRNPLDNREENLRPATHSQNSQNCGLLAINKSGYIGVHWHPRHERWMVKVKSGATATYPGYFEDLLEAVKAYDVAALYFHDPDFVVLNLERWHYPAGHPDTWPPGPFSEVIHRCRRQRGTGVKYNNVSGYWGVSWNRTSQRWISNTRINGRRISLTTTEHLLDAVKIYDIITIHLGRDTINLGRDHYPPGPPSEWPEDTIPDCPALRRLIDG